jgi:hypothetical protein
MTLRSGAATPASLQSSPVFSTLLRVWRGLRGPANTASAPVWAWPALLICLALQATLSSFVPRFWLAQTTPGKAPAQSDIVLWSLGETGLAAYAMNLYVQTFDSQAGRSLSLRSLDQQALRDWLNQSLSANPRSQYPLLLASRVYASASDPAESRKMLEFVHQRFLEVPDVRWPWLAHAVHVARHELGDIELAKRYARSLAVYARGAGVPSWARQLEVFLLEANNETEAARRLLGGLIESGQIKNEAELRFLAQRMKQLPDSQSSGADGRH